MNAYNYQINSKEKDIRDSMAIIEKPVISTVKKGSTVSTTTNFQTFVKVNHKGTNIKDYLPINIGGTKVPP